MVIVTGFYNAENYIERCLFSIKTQTFKDFKCYITHDLSTDNSVELVKKFIKDDPRFILVNDNEKKLYQAGNFDKTIRYNKDIDDNELIIEVDGVSAGQIRYQQVMVDDGNRSAKVSINIAKEFHGKGVASLAFKEGSDLVRRSKFAVDVFANVLPNNLGSIKAMQNAGFRIVKKYEVNGRDHLMMTDRQDDI